MYKYVYMFMAVASSIVGGGSDICILLFKRRACVYLFKHHVCVGGVACTNLLKEYQACLFACLTALPCCIAQLQSSTTSCQ